MNYPVKLAPIVGFSEEWWDVFFDKTANLSRPTVINDCFGDDDAETYTDSVLEILRILARLRTNRFGYRIFVEGRLLAAKEMNRVYDNPPLASETLETWAERIFEGKAFGIIINTGEKFEPRLSASIARRLEPLFRRIGMPREGVNFTLFIGNYDKTPLGVHQDKRGESVMHFHLGPTRKTMYVLDDPTYKAVIEGGVAREDTPAIIAQATRFEFGRGDLFYMPEGTWHIGEQSGFSIGVTVWQYNHTNSLLMANLHRFAYTRLFLEEDHEIHGDVNALTDSGGIDDVFRTNAIPEWCRDITYEQMLREMYVDWRHVLASNAGYRGIPFPQTENYAVSEDDVIRVARPYRIVTRTHDRSNKLHMFVRGHKIEFNNLPSIQAIIDRVNSGDRIRVADLAEVAGDGFPVSATLHIVNEIARCNGLEKVAGEALSGGHRHG